MQWRPRRAYTVMMDKLYEVGGVGDICFFLKTPSTCTCSYTRCLQSTLGGDIQPQVGIYYLRRSLENYNKCKLSPQGYFGGDILCEDITLAVQITLKGGICPLRDRGSRTTY